MDKALIISANIHSHYLPAFYLADILCNDYDFYFFSPDIAFCDLLKKEGFKYINKEKKKETTIRNFFEREALKIVSKKYYNNQNPTLKIEELEFVVNKLSPTVVFIDVFRGLDYLILKKRFGNLNFLFFNPMLSFNKYADKNTFENVSNKSFWFRLRKAKDIILEKKLFRNADIDEKDVNKNYPFTLKYCNVPELILAPSELEYDHYSISECQKYLGLCLYNRVSEYKYDSTFNEKWRKLLELKKENKKIILCSFGTFYKGQKRRLFLFIESLLTLLKDNKDTFLIISIDEAVIKALNKELIGENILLFSYVPQLTVLKHCDAFITHGGLGSIKESVFFEVPMLVYPLDYQYDQITNAECIQELKIGIKGNIDYDDQTEMKEKINSILFNSSFKENLKKLKRACNKYTEEYNRFTIKGLIGNAATTRTKSL